MRNHKRARRQVGAVANSIEQLEHRLVLSTFTVINTSPSGSGSLLQAIVNANNAGGGTIQFNSSLSGKTIFVASPGLSISSNINIDGLGATKLTVSGALVPADPVITVVSHTVSISGLTITGGNSPNTAGGGIQNHGDLTLTDCVVSDNQCGNFGGGIFNDTDGTLQLERCQVTGNSVIGAGGGIYNVGELFIDDSSISGNTQTEGVGGGGGGIDNTDTGNFTITDSTIANNKATEAAGGIDISSTDASTLSITNCTINNNSIVASDTLNEATGANPLSAGGGIFIADGTVDIESSAIINNSATATRNATSSDPDTDATATVYAAGGIVMDNGSVSIENSTIDSNSGTSNATASVPSGGSGVSSGVSDAAGGIIIVNGTLSLLSNTALGGSGNSFGDAANSIGNAYDDLIFVSGNASAENSVFSNTPLGLNDLGGNNFDGYDAMLAPLANNGGPTPTRLPMPGSPLIDAGINSGAFGSTDQRGFKRIVNNTIDIGAVEVQPPKAVESLGSSLNPSVAGQAVTFTAKLSPTAPGSNTPTGTLSFFDGTKLLQTVSLTNGVAKFTTSSLSVATHTITASYSGDVNFTPVTVTLSQKVNSASTGSVSVITDPCDSTKTALDIQGTNNADTITVTQSGSSQGKAVVNIDGVNKGTYSFTGCILVYGQSGNDKITIDSAITRSAVIYGGDGNDTVNGGGGNDMIIGQGGNDSLNGNGGRDILIGGDGADVLNGGSGDDLLIAGDFKSTAPTMAQLMSIEKEWDRTDKSYSSRVKDLTTGGGYNTIKLNSSTLFSSTTLKDSLTGGADDDLFFAAMTGDKITDKASSETAVNIG